MLGSSSLLATVGNLGEPGQPLEFSYDADVLIRPIDEEGAQILNEAVGQESFFSKRHGYYADILRPEIVETLPAGWESRAVAVPIEGASALNPYDLAIVKLVLGREKDLALLKALLENSIMDPFRLREHYQSIPLPESDSTQAGRNLARVLSQ